MSGYAVVDLQTTGLEPSMRHRVVEIAVVSVSEGGELEQTWCSLVNPERDVGETSLHGIAARDVLRAPTFDDLVPLVLASVTGRTLVAHNLRFELGFLESELRLSGVPLSMPLVVGVPTMDWFGLLSSNKRRRLVDCCSEVGVPLTQRYSSRHQAAAVADLLCRYISASNGSPPWEDALEWSQSYPWPILTNRATDCELLARDSQENTSEMSWLDRIISQMPSGGDKAVDQYLDVLEMALLDRYLSEHEVESLVAIASSHGLDRTNVEELHGEYLVAMARVALQDGIVTDQERRDLEDVAALLGLGRGSAVNDALLAATESTATETVKQGFALLRGDAICFTGSMSTPRDILEREAVGRGFVVGGLTRRTKLLVAADPDSLSGKAKKARDYGVAIVSEAGYRSILS